MRIHGAGHGHAVGFVFEPVVGLVFNRRLGGFLPHVFPHSPALNHKAVDDAMENGAIIMAACDIGQKIGRRLGGLLLIEFNDDVSHTGF